ncbi:IclR family transcriptional regulator [Accumulibacter sp.]|uniref:IclR family transcriptional regulator n=1 Tax=Accumulibacter sp. TaxID=2053492 RepID=UPI0026014EC3|nr:IclR family transcriptional regulator [Accumulibacter sp.]MCM8610582.1 IclR family transcriptional regulator [Accumulibacter sp.]MCM8634481.1 IclR family transcriptional regulator [Accumulibacter sp.]MCM8641690.1 IclR family transcriptional regulator [Accumulibacter sp.]
MIAGAVPEGEVSDPAGQRQGIQSVEIGTRLLQALASSGRSLLLRDLSRSAGMPAAKARRYLVSLIRMGLVEQDANTGRYDLGGFALELGLASLARLDPVRLAGPVLDDLCERTGETVALAMWGNRGATCVRWLEAGGPVTVTLRTGVVLPLLSSATGQAFAAFFRSPYLRRMLDAEIEAAAAARQATPAALRAALTVQLDEVRRHGIARAAGSVTPGVNGFSAPVFNHAGRMVAALTLLGIIGSFDLDWDSPTARLTKEAAATLSRRLGYGGGEAAEVAASAGHCEAAPGRGDRRA